MNKLHYYYLGSFPPPFGGVTVKNQLLLDKFETKNEVRRVDFSKIKRRNIGELFKFVHSVLDRSAVYIIGVSTGKNTRKNLVHLLYALNRRALKKSVLFIMGGVDSDRIAVDTKYRGWMSVLKKVYFELDVMKRKVEEAGLNNVAVYPNCRMRPPVDMSVSHHNGRLKCICFSMIYPDKGIDVVLEAAKQLPDVDFDFRGPVKDEYKITFTEQVDNLPNCNYKGVFKVENNNVYPMLNEYDVLLFPTRWISEGVPGTLIEAKIAALPAIVSDFAYNASLVEDGVSGIVMKENTVSCLVDDINRLDNDRDLLDRLKSGAKKSGENFYLDNYMESIYTELFYERN